MIDFISVGRTTLLLAFSALALAAAPSSSKNQPQPAPSGPLLDDGTLQRYRAEPGCSGKMHNLVQLFLNIGDVYAEAGNIARKPDALQRGQSAAMGYNKAAQAAADKGCPDAARRWWLTVIETYVGTGYAAMRQRAQIGIDDLRAASQRRPGIDGETSSP